MDVKDWELNRILWLTGPPLVFAIALGNKHANYKIINFTIATTSKKVMLGRYCGVIPDSEIKWNRDERIFERGSSEVEFDWDSYNDNADECSDCGWVGGEHAESCEYY